jgi:hypothetical protein
MLIWVLVRAILRKVRPLSTAKERLSLGVSPDQRSVACALQIELRSSSRAIAFLTCRAAFGTNLEIEKWRGTLRNAAENFKNSEAEFLRRTMKRTLLTRTMAALLWLVQSLSASAIVFTNDTLISPINTNYDGQDIVISNATLTVDGPHNFANLRAAAGSTLTHSATPGGTIVITASVTNELQLLTGTNAVVLVQPGIFLFSVMVRDETGTVTYTNTLDYLLSLTNSSATLQRTESSSIPDGATVLVSYDYSAGTTNAGLVLNISGDLDRATGAKADLPRAAEGQATAVAAG